MPGVDGYEVTRLIRNNPKHKFTKIILVSGKVNISDKLKGYKSGADDYITKPFNDDELEAKVEVFLKLKHTEEIEEIKSNFLNLIAHETRTPLNGIIAPAQYILNNASDQKSVKQFAEMILENSNILLNSVKKTTLLCNIKSGSGISKSYNNIIHFIKMIISGFENKMNEKKLKHQIITNVSDLNIHYDTELMKYVFQFIYDNAIKYADSETIFKTCITAGNKDVTITITDKGKPITDVEKKQVFKDIGSRKYLEHHQGLGISLFISKEIIELHNGKISIDNNEKNYTSVIITLPKGD